MRLYYFTSQKYGLAAIRDSRLKIARISQLNDPFEFLGLDVERSDRRVLNARKKQMDARHGIVCMSVDWTHPLLWGHYADKYKGMALGFDVVDDGSLRVVEYDALRPKLADLGRTSLDDFTEEELKTRLLYRKFDAWCYETEYRTFCELEEKDPATGLHFLPFSERMKLAQVILGHRCTVTRAELTRTLGDHVATVSSFMARPGFQRFEVVENALYSAWK